jgi:hypothetical protein
VDASEWTRKCELAGIFYSCEYVYRAVLATLQSASAPYRKALTIGLLVILLYITAHSVSPPPRTPPTIPSRSVPPSPFLLFLPSEAVLHILEEEKKKMNFSTDVPF